MKTKKAVGRPKQPPSDKEKRMVYVSPEVKAFYLFYGDGNFSKGLEVVKKEFERLSIISI